MASLRTLKRIFAAFMRFLGRLFASITAGALMSIAVVSLLARFAIDDKDSQMTLGIPAAFLWLGLAAMFSWPRFWGTSPRLTCPRCGARSQTTARFCHACAQTLVVRAPEATKRSSLGKALGGVGRLLAAFSGAALAFVLVVTAVYYLRLDTRFGIGLLLLTLLLASVACVVLVARPKTYGALLRTRRRSLVTGLVVVSTIVGLSALPDRGLPATLTAAATIARGLPVVTFGPPDAAVALIGVPLGDGNVLVDDVYGLTGADVIDITEAGTTRRATLIDVVTRKFALLKTPQGSPFNERGPGIGEPPPPGTEVLGVTYDHGAIRVAPVRVASALATSASYFAMEPAPSLPPNNSGLLLDRSGMVVGMVRAFGWNQTADVSAARSWVPQALARLARADDITNFIRPLFASWHPSGATVLRVEQNVLTATSLTGAAPTRLGILPSDCALCSTDLTNWSMRRDGSALVVSVEVAYETARLAMWELGTGVVRWLTAAEPRVRQYGPVWSPDGTTIYFARAEAGVESRLYAVPADGGEVRRIPVTTFAPGVAFPVAASAGGKLYVRYTYMDNARYFRVVDVATGGISAPWANDFTPTSVDAIRVAQPGALIQGFCVSTFCARPSDQRSCSTQFCTAPTRLMVFDERTGGLTGLTALLDDSVQVFGADWDPSGTRIVIASRATNTHEPFVLQTVDEAGGAWRTIAGTAWAMDPHWLPEGILYLWSASAEWRDEPLTGTPNVVPVMQGPFELRLVDPSTEASRTVFESESAFRFVIVGD